MLNNFNLSTILILVTIFSLTSCGSGDGRRSQSESPIAIEKLDTYQELLKSMDTFTILNESKNIAPEALSVLFVLDKEQLNKEE